MYVLSACFLALSAFFLSAVASPIADAAANDPPQPDHPPWNQVYIKSVNYAGSGCPAGSVAGTLASDGSFINVAFDKYTAQVYKDSKPDESRKNCQLSFVLQYPSGWSVTVFDAAYYGRVKLDKDVTALQQSTYRWGGQSPTATFYSTWKGKVDKDYTFTDSLVKSAYVWSSCKGVPGTLIVNTQISVDNSKSPKGTGLITTDSIEGIVTHKYGCSWKKC